MIPERSYQSILTNLSRHAPLDLDALLFDAPHLGNVSETAHPACSPSAAIWDISDDGPSRIGVRIKTPLENADFLATRLASIAVERQIYPVFLSYVGKCDMQRFGFRVEQLSGLTEQAQAQFEAQLARFWRFAMIIDASEIERLG